jgi:hypothetical protein
MKKFFAFFIFFLLFSVAVSAEEFEFEFVVVSSWGDGYNAMLAITNAGDADIDDWVLSVNENLGLGEHGASGGRVLSQSDELTVITHADWNRRISAGDRIELWLNGSHNGTAPSPTSYSLQVQVAETNFTEVNAAEVNATETNTATPPPIVQAEEEPVAVEIENTELTIEEVVVEVEIEPEEAPELVEGVDEKSGIPIWLSLIMILPGVAVGFLIRPFIKKREKK